MKSSPLKTHLFFNHSPITQLVIEETLKLSDYIPLYPHILVISTRRLQLSFHEIDEVCYPQEDLCHHLEKMFQFFYDEPPYMLSDQLIVFIPQTRYEIGRFLFQAPFVQSVHYLEEGVGTIAYGQLPTPRASSRRNSNGYWSNYWFYRWIKSALQIPMYLLKHPKRWIYLKQVVRFYAQPIHFMWRPTWHSKIGKVFAFHHVWPSSQQVQLTFPHPATTQQSNIDALLLLPHAYGQKKHLQFLNKLELFFQGLDDQVNILVKCHPSDSQKYWLDQCHRLYTQITDLQDTRVEAALYCYQHQIPYCFHFNSSSKEYFKFLRSDSPSLSNSSSSSDSPSSDSPHQNVNTLVIDLWSQSLSFQKILQLPVTQQAQLQSQYEYSKVDQNHEDH